MSIYDSLPSDIVHLAIRDQVPADGLFLSGFSVVIDESSLTGESENVMVNAQNDFLLSGTKVKYGSWTFMKKLSMGTHWIWSGDEAFDLLEYLDSCHNCCDFGS
ncbi:unnamed protein product [Brassica oleracea var. botrytis]|uniref:(rape) hypothetical protein n=1 Tax=Brassica napus TaxID=3708 RepID=A0A816J9N4_BRANA|nr:unnamed protein product [Brassica napus]